MSARSLHRRSSPRLRAVPAARIDALLQLVLSLRDRTPATGQPRRLTPLFQELGRHEPERDPEEICDHIWAPWITHKDGRACSHMAAAIEAMDLGAFDLARPILDRLVASEPGWSEAWNKRGTLAFIENRDADALGDIEHTLLLEPRHFGAVSGFGQICLRQGRLPEARAAFQVALAINPHLEGLTEAIEEICWATKRDFH
jgi:tetratricopeptide (TPR) repeat protein